MSKSSKGKHPTIEDREYIEVALHGRFTLQAIADRLGKDPTIISKEIKRNRMFSSIGKNSRDLVSCQHLRGCQRKHICNTSCKGLCMKRTSIFYCNPMASYQKPMWRRTILTSDMFFQKGGHVSPAFRR